MEFLPFGPDNQERLQPPAGRQGHAHLGRHLGRPLSRELWDDVTLRLRAHSLVVFRPGDPQPEVVWWECCLFLNEQGCLVDIWFDPACLPWKAGVVVER